jgi:hypothetical protein
MRHVILMLSSLAHAAAAPSCPPAPTGKGPQPVVVGIYINQIAAIDVKANTFLADFYLWFRWSGSIDPTQSFEMVNAVESWDFTKEAVYKDDDGNLKPDVLPDGCKFQQYHVQGRFAHPFQLSAYPLDSQEISIRLEDSRFINEELFYVADTKDARIDKTMQIPGWQVRSWLSEVLLHEYGSPMGDPRLTGLPCSQYRFTLRLGRPLVGYLSKTLVPIAFVLLITLLIFFVSLRYFEGRLGLAVTTLISAVALQLTTSADLPQVGYLVLVDKLYNLSYVLILFTMFESTLAVRWHDAGREDAARRLDRWAAILSTLGVGLAIGLIFYFA